MIKKILFIFYIILFFSFNNKIKADPLKEINPNLKPFANNESIIHYWNFNNSEFLDANITVQGGLMSLELATGGEIITGTGQGFAGLNAQNGDGAGNHLRINNPIGNKVLLTLPTVDYENVMLRYEARRSGQGAQIQKVSYSLNGVDYQHFESFEIKDTDPEIIVIDLSEIQEVDNNINFKVLIEFEQGAGGIAGNQRIDNITVSGNSLVNLNASPVVIQQIPFQTAIVDKQFNSINLLDIFSDPEGEVLTFACSSSNPSVAEASIVEGKLKVEGIRTGEVVIEVTAEDESANSTKVSFRLLIYPQAISLSGKEFSFSSWNENELEGSFPDHMIFLQSNKNDPTISDDLLYSYHVPHSDYSSDDVANIGFPYKNTSRTRINGLGENGISFINTGRGRDVGGVLIAVDTREIPSAKIKFTAETLISNPRVYNLAVFCRKNPDDDWTPVLSALQQPVSYESKPVAAGSEETIEVYLGQNFIGVEYVQILIKYYYSGVGSGGRTQIRLDDIEVAESERPEESGEVPGASTLLLPIDNSSDVSLKPIFTWENATNPGAFYFQLSETSTFETLIVNELIVVPTFNVKSELANSRRYYWRVKAINSFGESEWSSTFDFTTIGETPTQKLIKELSDNGVPVIEINTDNGNAIVSKEDYVKGNILIYEGSGENLAKLDVGELEIKGRGNSTWDFPKKPYRLKLGKAKSLLGMPENRHWVLLANYSDKSLLRTHTAFDISELLNLPYTPRDKAVQVVLNGEYLGSYQLVEAIKIGSDRVDISEIESNENGVTGGVILEVDTRRGEVYNFDSPQGLVFNVKDPDDLGTKDGQEIEKRLNYIKRIVINAENVLYSENFQDVDNGYEKHLNVPTFIDWYLVNEIFKNNDAVFWTSVYMVIDNNQKLSMGPVWDFDISAGNINYNGNENPQGFWIKNSPWISRLFQDTTFEKSLVARWKEVRENLISFLDSSITVNSRMIDKSQKSNFKKWPILGTYVWPNSFIGKSYEEEVEYFKQFLLKRIVWLDSQFAPDDPKVYPPIALEQSHYILEGRILSGVVKGFHPSSDIEYSITSLPSDGSIEFQESSGEFNYTPSVGFYGIDSFTYIVKNSGGTSHASRVTINVIENTPPTSIFLSSESVLENLPTGTVVGVLNSEGQVGELKFIYSFVDGEGGEDNVSFYLSGDTLKTSRVFDYEEKSFYNIKISTMDEDGFSFEQPFTVLIADQEEKFNIDENQEFNLYLGSDGKLSVLPQQLIEIPTYFNSDLVVLSKSTFDCTDLGRHLVEISHGDIKETINLHLIDTIAPIIKIKNVVVGLDDNGKIKITSEDVDDGSYDNCGIEAMSISKSEFDVNDESKGLVTLTAVDKFGNISSKEFAVTIDYTLGETISFPKFVTKLYPNPASDLIHLELDPNRSSKLEQIEIVDANGRPIRQYSEFGVNKRQVSLTIEDLSIGLYFLRVRHSKGVQLLKFTLTN